MLQKEIEKQQEDQKKLEAKKRELKAKGVALDDQGSKQVSVGPGHNPKESPEMFVKKILQNQKRMNRTIEKYEEE